MAQMVSTNPFTTKINTRNLRKCQEQAYSKVQQHFAKAEASRHILLQLPTGTGKSVIAAIIPFGIAKPKVLVIAPGLRLLKQLVKDLDLRKGTNKYDELGLCSPEDLQRLRGQLFLLELESATNSGDVLDNQVIVTNFHKLQDVGKWFAECKDEIDLIIIDDAHEVAICIVEWRSDRTRRKRRCL